MLRLPDPKGQEIKNGGEIRRQIVEVVGHPNAPLIEAEFARLCRRSERYDAGHRFAVFVTTIDSPLSTSQMMVEKCDFA